MMVKPTKEKGWHLTVLILLVVLLVMGSVAFGVDWIELNGNGLVVVWLAAILVLIIFICVASSAVTGLKRGILIDGRNKISLSRLQMLFWTVLIGATLYSLYVWNISLLNLESPPDGLTDITAALNIEIPKIIWALLGISTTSLVASPLVLSTKTEGQAQDTEKQDTIARVKSDHGGAGDVEAKGKVIVNTNANDARFTDIFKGEETGNGASVDLAKVQMFFFSLIAGIAYITAIVVMLAGAGGTMEGDIETPKTWLKFLPEFSQGLVAILGISHAGYLTHKAIPHSQAQTGDAAGSGGKGGAGGVG